MKTLVSNQLLKGDMVILRNGWKARLEDNKKGNIRMATVFGAYTEMGSIYSHDIRGKVEADGTVTIVVPTPAQQKLRNTISRLF